MFTITRILISILHYISSYFKNKDLLLNKIYCNFYLPILLHSDIISSLSLHFDCYMKFMKDNFIHELIIKLNKWLFPVYKVWTNFIPRNAHFFMKQDGKIKTGLCKRNWTLVSQLPAVNYHVNTGYTVRRWCKSEK